MMIVRKQDEKLFDRSGFWEWIDHTYNEKGPADRQGRETVDNVISYGLIYHTTTINSLANFLSDVIANVSMAEIAQFIDPSLLSETVKRSAEHVRLQAIIIDKLETSNIDKTTIHDLDLNLFRQLRYSFCDNTVNYWLPLENEQMEVLSRIDNLMDCFIKDFLNCHPNYLRNNDKLRSDTYETDVDKYLCNDLVSNFKTFVKTYGKQSEQSPDCE